MFLIQGLINRLFDIVALFWYKKPLKILFLGLENAGKTTLLGLLKTGHVSYHVPTHFATHEQLQLAGHTFDAFDLGGHIQARRVWRTYFPAADGIVFLVDVADEKKLMVAKQELLGLLADPDLSALPILVLGNKIDKFGALSEEQLKAYLEIADQTTGKKNVAASGRRPLEAFMCSLVMRQGFGDAFLWLAAQFEQTG